MCVFYGAKQYYYCLSFIYFVFMILGTIAELTIVYIYYLGYKNHQLDSDLFIVAVIYQSLFFILRLYITRFISIFTNKLKNGK